MRSVIKSFINPSDNVAFDEVLLEKADSSAEEMVWIWESAVPFVALGRTSKADEEVFIDRCRRDGINIVRRLSGGCSVLQGPGCLNYSFVLSYDRSDSLKNVGKSYEFLLQKIACLLKDSGLEVSRNGLSDLVFQGKKFSGNAQIRRGRFLLHHGTILFDMDFRSVREYLRHPPREPKYRTRRSHEDFLINLPIDPQTLRNILTGVFDGHSSEIKLSAMEEERLLQLSSERYSSDEWNFRF